MMEVKVVRYDNDVVRVDVLGSITRDGWPTQREPLAGLFGEEIYRQTVLLNLSNSNYLDSTGVEWLLIAHKRFSVAGGKLIIHSAKPVMQQILKLMRMNLVLNLAADEEKAREMANGALHEQAQQPQ
jgi:anti-anti-sigma factor